MYIYLFLLSPSLPPLSCRRTGVMVFGESNAPYVVTTAESLRQANIAHEVFTGHEAKRRYPHQLKIPDTYMCVREEDGGILYAQRALKAVQVGTFLCHT